MKKVMEVVSYVMLGVVIVAVIIFISPWIPVNGGLWSPLDVLKDKMDDFYVGSVEEFTEPEHIELEFNEAEFTEPAPTEPKPIELPAEPEFDPRYKDYSGPHIISEEKWESLPLRAEISTMEQAIEYFDTRFPELIMGVYCADDSLDYYWIESGYVQCHNPSDWVMDRAAVVNGITYLLSDDMEIYTVIGFRHRRGAVDKHGMPKLAINCIKTEDGYEFIDPVKGMQGDAGSRVGGILPEAKVSSIEEYVDLITSDPEIYEALDFLYLFKGGDRIEYYVDEQGISTLRYPMQKAVYQNLDKDMAQALRESKAHIKPENINHFQLSRILGGTTLTPEEARKLVYAKPEEVKEAVKTAGDMLMFMLAAQLTEGDGCYHTQIGNYMWHWNMDAPTFIKKGRGGCGDCANLANYLLEDDYEEVGFIIHAFYAGGGGGHVYNYFLYEGKYYIVDFSWYLFANYVPSNDFPVQVLNSLEEYDGTRANRLYKNVCLVFAHTSDGMHLPNIFGNEHGDPTSYYVPEGAEYTVLYQAEDGYQMKEMPFNKSYYDWTTFWPGYTAP